MKLVSVYMTVKNGYPFIIDSIESVKSQTYKNWELIVVDDGSSDETTEYLKSIEKADSRFKFIYTSGVGRSKALNIAVNHSNGDLIANLDADDLAHPERLELQVKTILFGQNINFLCSKSIIIFDDDRVDWPPVMGGVDDVTSKLLITNPVNHSSVMMTRSLFDELGGYNEKINKTIDYDLWCRVCLCGYHVYRLRDKLVGKRIHDFQSFENKKRVSYLLSSYRIRQEFINSFSPSFFYSAINFFKLIYGLLPQRFRMLVKTIK